MESRKWSTDRELPFFSFSILCFPISWLASRKKRWPKQEPWWIWWRGWRKSLLSDSRSGIDVSPDLPGVLPTHPPGAREKDRVMVALSFWEVFEDEENVAMAVLSLCTWYVGVEMTRKRCVRGTSWSRYRTEDTRIHDLATLSSRHAYWRSCPRNHKRKIFENNEICVLSNKALPALTIYV